MNTKNLAGVTLWIVGAVLLGYGWVPESATGAAAWQIFIALAVAAALTVVHLSVSLRAVVAVLISAAFVSLAFVVVVFVLAWVSAANCAFALIGIGGILTTIGSRKARAPARVFPESITRDQGLQCVRVVGPSFIVAGRAESLERVIEAHQQWLNEPCHDHSQYIIHELLISQTPGTVSYAYSTVAQGKQEPVAPLPADGVSSDGVSAPGADDQETVRIGTAIQFVIQGRFIAPTNEEDGWRWLIPMAVFIGNCLNERIVTIGFDGEQILLAPDGVRELAVLHKSDELVAGNNQEAGGS